MIFFSKLFFYVIQFKQMGMLFDSKIRTKIII